MTETLVAPSGRVLLGGGAYSDRLITDEIGTDLDNLGTGPFQGLRVNISAGTQAAPITEVKPLAKLSATFGVTLATAGAIANNEKAGTTFAAYAQDAAGCGIQVVGLLGSAKMLTATGSDAVGLYGLGTASGAATGIGTGGYFEGRRFVAGAKALGAEVRVSNVTASDGSYSSSGVSDTGGLWITTAGTSGADSGAGISLGGISSSQFKVGYGVTAGSVADSSFRDDSSSGISLDIRGTHTYAIDTSNFTPASNSRAVRLGNTHRFSAVNAAGNGVIDLFAADNSDRFLFFPGTPGTVQFSNQTNMAFSTGTNGTKIGTGATQKMGFWNATPVVQPTAVANATDAATVITQLNNLLTKLRTIGLIAT